MMYHGALASATAAPSPAVTIPAKEKEKERFECSESHIPMKSNKFISTRGP